MAKKLGKFLILTAAVSTAAAAAIYYMRKKASDAEDTEEMDAFEDSAEDGEDPEIRSYVPLYREGCEEDSTPSEAAEEVIEKTEEFFGEDTQ